MIKIWSINTGLTNRTIAATFAVSCLKLLKNGIYLAAGVFNNTEVYNLNDGILVTNLRVTSKNWLFVRDLELISSDLLASSNMDSKIRIWNLTTRTEKFTMNGHASDVFGLKLLTSTILASGSYDATIKLWNISSGELIKTLTGHTGPIWFSVDMLTDGQTLVTASWDQTIKLWDWTIGECLKTVNTSLSIRSLAVINSTTKESKYRLFIKTEMKCALALHLQSLNICMF